MADSPSIAIKVLTHVLDFLRKLSPDQEASLAEGRGRLVLVEIEDPEVRAKSARKLPRAMLLTPEELRERLGAMGSRAEAELFLSADRITREQLREIARNLDIVTPSKDRKSDVVDRIVEETLGFRLSDEAIGRGQH